MQGDTTRTYKTTTRVLRSMSLPGILGMNFLLENDVCIDLASGINTLDNKSYEFKIKKSIDQLDSDLIKRTRINLNISTSHRIQVRELIKEYKLKALEGCEIKEIEHSINITDQKIINLAPYRILHNLYKLVKEEIQYLKSCKIIRESTSKYSFPAFPILKQNGRIRLVVDCRRLNQITKKTRMYSQN